MKPITLKRAPKAGTTLRTRPGVYMRHPSASRIQLVIVGARPPLDALLKLFPNFELDRCDDLPFGRGPKPIGDELILPEPEPHPTYYDQPHWSVMLREPG